MTTTSTRIVYVGVAGAGLGFRSSGVDVVECSTPEEMITSLRQLKEAGSHSIIFIDEGLAEQHLDAIAKLNQDMLPALILLPNPVEAKNVAATNLQQLMIRAIGSDIF